MDDANLPSLLSLPFLDYCNIDDEKYQSTRKMALSWRNPFYSKGIAGEGIGGPHVGQVNSFAFILSLILIRFAQISQKNRDGFGLCRLLCEL